MDGYKEALEKQRVKKVNWLKKKWGEATKNEEAQVEDFVRNIVVKDEVLTEEFSSEPGKYGNAVVDEMEWKVLTIPPKLGLYRKITTRDIIISLEEALNKLRWNRMYEVKSSEIAEENFVEGNKVDINKLKRTELPFNYIVNMPGALKQEEEVRIQNFKNEVKEIA